MTVWLTPIIMSPRSGSHSSRKSRWLTLPSQHPCNHPSGSSVGVGLPEAAGTAIFGGAEGTPVAGAPGPGAGAVCASAHEAAATVSASARMKNAPLAAAGERTARAHHGEGARCDGRADRTPGFFIAVGTEA